jgi:hypothetical protein
MPKIVNEGFLLEGTAYFDRLDSSGAATGLVLIPGITALSFGVKSDLKEITSKDRGYYGQVIATVAIPKPTEVKATFANATKDGIALALMGTSSSLNEGAHTVAAEDATAHLDKWVELAHRNVTASSVVVKDAATGLITYVENTDYEINYALGLFRAIPAGAVTEAEALHVDYNCAAYAGWKVQGVTSPTATGRLILDGRNLINNKSVRLEAYHLLLVADGDFNIMSDNLAEYSFSGRMSTPSGKTEPFILEQW